jgi:glutamate dehydrogenase
MALLQAEDVLNIPEYRRRVLAEGRSRPGAYAALVELDDGVRNVAHYLVRSGVTALDPEPVERRRAGIDALRSAARGFLSTGVLQRFDARRERLLQQGLPEDLAYDIAGLPLADRGLNILSVCEGTSISPIDAARVYARLGDATGINWIYARLDQTGLGTLWDRILLLDLRWDLLDLQRRITRRVLAAGPDDVAAAVDAFLESHADAISGVEALQRQSAAAVSSSALVVITARLRGLLADTDA